MPCRYYHLRYRYGITESTVSALRLAFGRTRCLYGLIYYFEMPCRNCFLFYSHFVTYRAVFAFGLAVLRAGLGHCLIYYFCMRCLFYLAIGRQHFLCAVFVREIVSASVTVPVFFISLFYTARRYSLYVNDTVRMISAIAVPVVPEQVARAESCRAQQHTAYPQYYQRYFLLHFLYSFFFKPKKGKLTLVFCLRIFYH